MGFSDQVVKFSNGVAVVSFATQSFTFLDGGKKVVVEPCGSSIKVVEPSEEPTFVDIIVEDHRSMSFGKAELFMATQYCEVPGGHRVHLIDHKPAEYRETDEGREVLNEVVLTPVLVLGTIPAMEAYPRRVVMPLPAPGYENVRPMDALMATDRFAFRR